jgi:hypothetical protein
MRSILVTAVLYYMNNLPSAVKFIIFILCEKLLEEDMNWFYSPSNVKFLNFEIYSPSSDTLDYLEINKSKLVEKFSMITIQEFITVVCVYKDNMAEILPKPGILVRPSVRKLWQEKLRTIWQNLSCPNRRKPQYLKIYFRFISKLIVKF